MTLVSTQPLSLLCDGKKIDLFIAGPGTISPPGVYRIVAFISQLLPIGNKIFICPVINFFFVSNEGHFSVLLPDSPDKIFSIFQRIQNGVADKRIYLRIEGWSILFQEF